MRRRIAGSPEAHHENEAGKRWQGRELEDALNGGKVRQSAVGNLDGGECGGVRQAAAVDESNVEEVCGVAVSHRQRRAEYLPDGHGYSGLGCALAEGTEENTIKGGLAFAAGDGWIKSGG